MKKGKVFLVGAGPGDPGLFTLRGSECLRQADVVVYDHLVNAAVVALAPKRARLVYAGKSCGRHALSQARINRLLVREALQGNTVVRLKGGDPILFGRGAEEGMELARHGISFEIVPGVTSAVAVPAAAGIPLTHRSFASTVTVVTGHESPDKSAPAVEWKKLLDARSTVVVLMGVANIRAIARRLGRPETPAAVIREGTLPSQRVVTGTLATIAGIVEREGIRPPAILVAGRVVGLRDRLQKFMDKPFLPLSGKHILVTRPAPAGETFAGLLRAMGAKVALYPLIRILPASTRAVDAIVRRVSSCRWVVLSSANGADLFAAALKRIDLARGALAGTKFAAIGPKTAERLKAHGLRPALVPETYDQEALAAAFARLSARDRGPVLLLHAQESREMLENALAGQGFKVGTFDLYRTAMTGNRTTLKKLLVSSPVDAVTITSSTAARSLAQLLDAETLQHLPVAAIGPVCAATARALGMQVSVVAETYTVEGLAESLAAYFRSRHYFTAPEKAPALEMP